MDLNTTAAAKPTFLTLPVEIRLITYDYIRTEPTTVPYRVDEWMSLSLEPHYRASVNCDPYDPATVAALGRTCRQIHQEIAHCNYRDWCFGFWIQNNPYCRARSNVMAYNGPETVLHLTDLSFLSNVELCYLNVTVWFSSRCEIQIVLMEDILAQLCASEYLREFKFETRFFGGGGHRGLNQMWEFERTIRGLKKKARKEGVASGKNSTAVELAFASKVVAMLKRSIRKDGTMKTRISDADGIVDLIARLFGL